MAGEGLLLVIAGNSLTVYAPGGPPGCDYKGVARWGWYDPLDEPAAAARQAFESDAGQLRPGSLRRLGPQVTATGARLTTAGGELGIRPVGATGPRWTRGERRLDGVVNLIGARERHVRIRRYDACASARPGRASISSTGCPAPSSSTTSSSRPGADLGRARIALDGARDLRLDATAALVARVGSATVRQAAAGRVPGRPAAAGPLRPARARHVSFSRSAGATRAGAWSSTPCSASPASSAAGCTTRSPTSTVDATGNVYVTGWTRSRDFATGNALFGWDEWNAMCESDTCSDAFVAKYAPGGRSLVYLTLLSGDGEDRGNAIAADASGRAYVAGNTTSRDFPTRNAAQGGYGGGAFDGDAFVAKLAPDGSALEWSTYHGGSGTWGRGRLRHRPRRGGQRVRRRPHRLAWTFPTTAGAADRVCTANRPSRAATRRGCVKYTSAGGRVYSTYFGGDEASEQAMGIAVDRAGRAVIAGLSNGSSDFPVTPGAYDPTPDPYFSESFAARLNGAGTAVEWATTFGGLDFDDAHGTGARRTGPPGGRRHHRVARVPDHARARSIASAT